MIWKVTKEDQMKTCNNCTLNQARYFLARKRLEWAGQWAGHVWQGITHKESHRKQSYGKKTKIQTSAWF